LWVLSYVGAWFNALTLIIIGEYYYEETFGKAIASFSILFLPLQLVGRVKSFNFLFGCVWFFFRFYSPVFSASLV